MPVVLRLLHLNRVPGGPMRSFESPLILLAIAGLCTCASVTARRVTVNKDGEEKATGPEGFRFYRPRPYVAVRKAFPVTGDDLLISGQIQDGFVFIPENELSGLAKECADLLPSGKDGRVAAASSIPLGPNLRMQAAKEGAPGGSSGKDSSTGKGKEDGGKGKNGDKGKAAEPPADGEDSSTKDDASNEKSKDARGSDVDKVEAGSEVVRLNDYFDIVYLPDFEEDYVLSPNAGAAVAELNLALGNGWMLEHAAFKTDNSGVTSLIKEIVDKALALAVPVPGVTSEAAPTETLATEADALRLQASKPHTVVLHAQCFLEAQPGVYPLLKPSEQKAVGSMAASARRAVFVPYPPLTVVPYNVIRRLRLEAVSVGPAGSTASSSSPGPVQPKVAATAEEASKIKKWVEQVLTEPASRDVASHVVLKPPPTIEPVGSERELTIFVATGSVDDDALDAAGSAANKALAKSPPPQVQGKKPTHVTFMNAPK